MSDPIQRSPRVRRGGGLALITVVALLVLASGAYALGRNTSPTTAQRATDAPAAAMTTRAQPRGHEPAGMRAHHGEWGWTRAHRDAIGWMRAHHAEWQWIRTHPHAWMRVHREARQSPPRSHHDAGSSRGCPRQHERMHDGGTSGHRRR